jgi:hypothetical protein
MFHADIIKVDRHVAYVAIVVHVCCKLLFPMFHLFFSDACCKCLSRCYICFTHCMCFIWILHIFCNGFFKRFSGVFISVSDIYLQAFQLFRTYVANVLLGCFKRLGVALSFSPSAVSPRCLLLFSMLVMFELCGPAWGRAAWVELVVRAAQNPSRRGMWGEGSCIRTRTRTGRPGGSMTLNKHSCDYWRTL